MSGIQNSKTESTPQWPSNGPKVKSSKHEAHFSQGRTNFPFPPVHQNQVNISRFSPKSTNFQFKFLFSLPSMILNSTTMKSCPSDRHSWDHRDRLRWPLLPPRHLEIPTWPELPMIGALQASQTRRDHPIVTDLDIRMNKFKLHIMNIRSNLIINPKIMSEVFMQLEQLYPKRRLQIFSLLLLFEGILKFFLNLLSNKHANSYLFFSYFRF